MTEQPDTAAIREWYVGRRRPSSPTMIAALCDALDAARAELMDQSDRRMDAKFYADPELLVRAEAAVAVTERLTGELDAAEARIAAALAACSDWETGDHWSPEALLRAVRRALTEGTSNGD